MTLSLSSNSRLARTCGGLPGWSAAVACLLASACAAVGPNFNPPAAPQAAGYTAAGEALPRQADLGGQIAADWWTLFRSPELDQVVRRALADNQTLAAAQATLAQARDTVAAQPGDLTGQVTAGVSRQHINLAGFGFTAFPNPTVNLYSVGASVRYDFDLFGGTRRQHESLQAQAEAQAAQLDAAYLTLTGQVVHQSVTLAALGAQIASQNDLIASDRASLDLASKAVKAGAGSKFDLQQAESQQDADLAGLPALRQQQAVARHALSVLVGQAPADWGPPEFALERIALPDRLPVALPSALVRQRPDIRAAEARLHAATAAIGVADARLYPDLVLSADLTQTSLQPDKIFDKNFTGWALGPIGVSLPILGRGALKAQSRQAQDAARAALAQYHQTVLEAFAQVADVLQAIRNDDVAFAAQTQALASAQETLRLSRLAYGGGRTGLLPVVDAQRAFARTRLALARAQAQRYADAAQLLLATGRGWNAAPPPAAR